MFVDVEKISIKAGDGGDGATSFIRYKGVSNGGPDGGDGGDGGSIYVVGDRGKNSLIDFEFKKKFTAENGEKGAAKKCFGKCGEDTVIAVPLGTVIKDAESGRIIADIFFEGERKLLLEGGKGGKGNAKFATSRRHTPHFAQKGENTQVRRILLELKVIADVGLIGFPNVGKSTILGKISGAKPKIANYHFTTLSPNLGVVTRFDRSFVVADIPGIIEGAADGAGLGLDFLRHIERTRMLVHVVDISGCEGRNPYDDYKKINAELKKYSPALAKAKQIIIANKTDIYGAADNLKEFKKHLRGKQLFPVSAITGEGLEAALDAVAAMLDTLPPVAPLEYEPFGFEKKNPDGFEIERDDDGAFVIIGPLVELLTRNVVLDDMDSLAYMQKTLKDKGVITELRRCGAKDGDTVVIGEVEFDFVD